MKSNKRMISRSLTTLFVAILMGGQASAQIHIANTEQPRLSILTEEQFQQELYASSVLSAKQYLQNPYSNVPVAEHSDEDRSLFYKAVAQLRITAPGCEQQAIDYYNATSNIVYKHRVALALGRYYFINNKLAAAIPWYVKADIANLSNQEIADKKFELAYCYFNLKQFDQAEPLFATIKEIKGKYYNPGNYYYGLLAYNKGDYSGALKSFERINTLPEYKSIVPYYIAEIYYFKGDRAKVLSEALRLIALPEKLYYDNELHLLAAQCYFEQKKFKEALPYFEYYYDHSDHIRRDELYELAYCYYQLKDLNKSIDNFKQLSNTQDSLGQSAMYLLGDCYLKKGDKKSARNAFATCADMSFNAGQREASLLIAGKLAYETGYYDEASRRINTLLHDYPHAAGATEAKTISSDLLARTNNYAAAYNNLKGLKLQDENAHKVYQKVAYGYAMLQLQDGKLNEADQLLAQATANPSDDNYTTAANFWRSDIAYQRQQYKNVILYGNEYLKTYKNAAGASYISPMATEQHVYMNMGYAAMKTDDFEDAKTYFGKAQHAAGGGATAANAVLREADAAFMQKDFKEALSLYDKAALANTNADADYARFQKSIILGLQNKTAEKIAILQSLTSQAPPSAYAAEARYELASTYLDQDKYQESINLLQTIAANKDSRRAPSALLKMGFAYQELDKDEEAKQAFSKVVAQYPASEEKAAALDALRNLYIQNNQPAEYAKFLQENNLSGNSNGSLDSTYYAAAEAQYAAGKYEQAKTAMEQYLSQFKDGVFTTKAHYYKAESEYQLKQNDEALKDYAAVLATPWSVFSENSARRAAVISYQKNAYDTANTYYEMLGANSLNEENKYVSYIGLMKTDYYLKKYAPAIAYADTLLAITALNETTLTEAAFYKAKSLIDADPKDTTAMVIFQGLKTAKTNAIATEARYYVAQILLGQNKLKEAEAAANETIQKAGGNDYWIVKSYLLLADMLVQQKDYFNAKATLQSVIKNTKIAALKEEATKKLEEVKSLEKPQSKLQD